MNIKMQFQINTKIDTVYNAVTTAQGIHGWWSQNSAVALEVGGEHIMYFVKQGQTIIMKFKVDVMEANKRTGWTCTQNGNPAWIGTKIGFELKEEQGSINVSFTHSAWDEKFKDTPLYASVPATWEAFMRSLKDYCEKGAGQPW